MKPSNVLLLPGWENSGPQHWQSLWESRHGYLRVEQHDWIKPLRGDWVARLEDVILTCDEPVVLVAHRLCQCCGPLFSQPGRRRTLEGFIALV